MSTLGLLPEPRIIHADCIVAMAEMDAESIDAIVTDPPYGLEFMGKSWDKIDWRDGGGFSKPGIGERPTAWTSFGGETANPTCAICGGRARGARKCLCETPEWRVKGESMTDRSATRSHAMQDWHERWATAAFRVAKPGAYLLAFGGTRTVHRMTCAIEDAGWIIRDMLCWIYAAGFPKGRANLKPAFEPIILARKPGPLRPLAIDACRINAPTGDLATSPSVTGEWRRERWGGGAKGTSGFAAGYERGDGFVASTVGRWPSNVLLSPVGDGLPDIFDGGWDGVVGGGITTSGKMMPTVPNSVRAVYGQDAAAGYTTMETYGDSGTASRFFLIPKASREDRETLVANVERAKPKGSRHNTHPTVKPVALMTHLVRLVTPPGGVVLDPFAGSGSTVIAARKLGFESIAIEMEQEYVDIMRERLE